MQTQRKNWDLNRLVRKALQLWETERICSTGKREEGAGKSRGMREAGDYL